MRQLLSSSQPVIPKVVLARPCVQQSDHSVNRIVQKSSDRLLSSK